MWHLWCVLLKVFPKESRRGSQDGTAGRVRTAGMHAHPHACTHASSWLRFCATRGPIGSSSDPVGRQRCSSAHSLTCAPPPLSLTCHSTASCTGPPGALCIPFPASLSLHLASCQHHAHYSAPRAMCHVCHPRAGRAAEAGAAGLGARQAARRGCLLGGPRRVAAVAPHQPARAHPPRLGGGAGSRGRHGQAGQQGACLQRRVGCAAWMEEGDIAAASACWGFGWAGAARCLGDM